MAGIDWHTKNAGCILMHVRMLLLSGMLCKSTNVYTNQCYAGLAGWSSGQMLCRSTRDYANKIAK